MLDLRVRGHGLPMNAYPPDTLVTGGVYAWFANPIYLGAVCIAYGASLGFHSGAGLYLVTPLLAAGALSLLLGYEAPATAARFGEEWRRYRPLFSLPAPSDAPAGTPRRLAMLARVFVPWAGAVAAAPESAGLALARVPVPPPWMLPYLVPAVLLLAARTQRALRGAAVAGTVATLLGLLLEAMRPGLAPGLLDGGGSGDGDGGWRRAGLHLGAVLVGANQAALRRALRRWTERVANSRRDLLLAGGRFRIINHAVYAALAGACGVGLSGFVMGHAGAGLVLLGCVVLGAAMFAQASWGSRSLLRPFGYWGGIQGGIVGIAIAHFAYGIPVSRIALGAALSAPFVQAAGRLRCLAQGCCHGVPVASVAQATAAETDGTAAEATAEPAGGIRVWQPQSRVVLLSHLAGVPLLNTQLWSILFNLAIGPLLWSLWLRGAAPDWTLVGLYFVLTGLERFAEDAYRGETQVRMRAGLRESQRIAITAVVAGMVVAALPGTPLAALTAGTPPPPPGSPGPALLAAALAGGAFTAFAMSMDFPKSSVRFSRLTG
jgi:uncharacterized membrane protein